MGRWRSRVGRAGRRVAALGRRAGLLPYRPERWTTDRWTAAYRGGHLGYYARLDELPRYSVLAGYVGWVAETAEAPPRLLDVGCGTGLLRRRLDDATFSSYVGVDLSEAAVATANAAGQERSRFVVGDVTELDVGDDFDVVVLNEVLYYAADAAAFLDRIRSLTAPDGVVLVSMWRHEGDRALWRVVDRVLTPLDRVEVRNRGNEVNPRGWRVAAYRIPLRAS
jgi:SAM-dependent methyltransferase